MIMHKECKDEMIMLIDNYITELKDGKEWGASIPVITLEALKEILNKEEGIIRKEDESKNIPFRPVYRL